MKSIVIIIDYFGEWPEWFPIFLETCRRNATINWLFHTDCPYDQFNIENVEFKYTTKEEYVKLVNKKLGVQFNLENNYKLCDLRPMYGVLYEEEISNFDFYGYGDIDVIYGNIRHFYTDDVLKNNVISTHNWCISGHLALFRNLKWIRNAFKRYKGWRDIIENPKNQRFDEDLFISVFRYPLTDLEIFHLINILNPFGIKNRRKLYLTEQFTTPLTPSRWRGGRSLHPHVWYWKDGRVTNDMDGKQEYIYLHFMNFFSARWMDPKYIGPTWKELGSVVFIKPDEIREEGMRIDRFGFHAIG